MYQHPVKTLNADHFIYSTSRNKIVANRGWFTVLYTSCFGNGDCKIIPLGKFICIKHLTEVSTSCIPIPSTIPLQDLVILKFTWFFGQRIWNWKTRSHFFFHDVEERVGNKLLHLIIIKNLGKTVQVYLKHCAYVFKRFKAGGFFCLPLKWISFSICVIDYL